MCIFAHYIWDLAFSCSPLHSIYRWIHITSHIYTHRIRLAFTVDRAGRVVIFEVPDHISVQSIGMIRVTCINHFISDRPYHNCRVILQSLVCSFCSVQTKLIEQSLRTAVSHNRVAFHVRLCNHVKSILITQPIQILIITIVGSTDCVQVVLLHQLHILKLSCLRHSFSVNRICIMPVGSLQKKPLSVNLYRFPGCRRYIIIAVYLCSGKLNLTESKLRRQCLNRFSAAVFQRQYESIQIRMLRRPQLRAFHFLFQSECFCRCRANFCYRNRGSSEYIISFFVQCLYIDCPPTLCLGRQVANINRKTECRIYILIVQGSTNCIILNLYKRLTCQVNITEIPPS